MTDEAKEAVGLIDSVLQAANGRTWGALENVKCGDLDIDYMCVKTRAQAAVVRIAGASSVYMEQCEKVVKQRRVGREIPQLTGVLQALRSAVESGLIASQRELAHGALFADFLEMAQHLLDEGYKDAAAVIAGSLLESHPRQLCTKHEVDTEITNRDRTRPKKADMMNSDLRKAEVYTELDKKNITAWLDLRNKAAHGKYDEYEKKQVESLVFSVRDFINRRPA